MSYFELYLTWDSKNDNSGYNLGSKKGAKNSFSLEREFLHDNAGQDYVLTAVWHIAL